MKPISIPFRHLSALCVGMCLSMAQLQALTNLVQNGEFEGTATGIIQDNDFTALFPQWTTQSNNDFDIDPQLSGASNNPANGSDGLPTGQHLEIRGSLNTGIITLTVVMPVDILPTATLRFDAWSRGLGYVATGRYRVVVSGTNNSDTGEIVMDTPRTAWTLNEEILTVATGDTVTVTWWETGTNNANRGLHIDDVQLLVTIIPEPGHIGALLGGAVLGVVAWRRRTRMILDNTCQPVV
ncbi:MAG: PEP-CTERM sorting domain-containing protein [Candidatus Methylacidiphilales bacterium]